MKKAIILCVDDEKVVLTSLKAQLKKHFGNEYTIETSENGADAYDFVLNAIKNGNEVPVIISDHIMPGMKGDELLINVHTKLPGTLSIMLTGQADAGAVGNALNQAKLYRYIPKPWDEMDLRMTIKEALRRYYQDKKIEEQNKELAKLVIQLRQYNETLEQKVKERTAMINEQKEEIIAQRDLLAKQKEDITDSIVYASLIQQALLPSAEAMENNRLQQFILYKPRDIVSGDFYWYKQLGKFIYIAAADCTGHGVPGAFMMTLGVLLLDEVLNKNEIIPTEIVLDELRAKIKKMLHQNKTGDGMDIALCLIDIETKKLQFSGANRPMYLVRNNELTVFKSDTMPIGAYPKDEQSFTSHQIQLHSNDIFYLFSDGYTSQFGGEKSFKYSPKRFKETLLKIRGNKMETQKRILEESLYDWQGKHKQIDDILVIGIKIK